MNDRQFNLRDVLLAVAFISGGLGCWVAANRLAKVHDITALGLGFFGMMAVGAGVMFPLDRRAAGMAIALGLVMLLIVYAAAMARRGISF